MVTTVYELDSYYVKGWKVEVVNESQGFMENSSTSLSFVVGLFFNELVSKEYPHNLIFTNQGKICYILARKFSEEKLGFNTSWLDLAGYPCCYEEISEEQILEGLAKISLNKEEHESITSEIKAKIELVFDLN